MATTFSRLCEWLPHRARVGHESSFWARLVGLDHSIARRRRQRRHRLRQPNFQTAGRTESWPTIARPHSQQSGWPRDFRGSARDRRRRARLIDAAISQRKSLWQRLGRSLAGDDVAEQLRHYNEQFPVTYRYWFESLYKDKYYYMGDADLMSAALLLDVSSYYLGLVRAVYRDPESGFLNLPFTGIGGRFARNVMTFYGRRLVALANRRWATGYYGKRNAGWRELYDGFVPDIRIRKQIRRGLLRWWKCELINLALMLRGRVAMSAKQASATVPTEAW